MSKEDAKYRLKLIRKCIADIVNQLAALDEDVAAIVKDNERIEMAKSSATG